MALEVRIAKGYAWRMIIIAVASLVLGLWGLYDYVVKIPRSEKLYGRLELLEQSKAALETNNDSAEAIAAVDWPTA